MYEYSREVFYYETDKMAVVHHSNFIRWLEEARTKYFDDAAMPYTATEAGGVLSPVTGMEFGLKHFARFGDRFTVYLKMTKYTGVRFVIRFTIVNQDGELLCEGESRHAFVSAGTYRPVSLARALPHVHERMKLYVEE